MAAAGFVRHATHAGGRSFWKGEEWSWHDAAGDHPIPDPGHCDTLPPLCANARMRLRTRMRSFTARQRVRGGARASIAARPCRRARIALARCPALPPSQPALSCLSPRGRMIFGSDAVGAHPHTTSWVNAIGTPLQAAGNGFSVIPRYRKCRSQGKKRLEQPGQSSSVGRHRRGGIPRCW